MNFLKKIEAYIKKQDKPHKPVKFNKVKNKYSLAVRDEKKLMQTNFSHLRRGLSALEDALEQASPFDFTDVSWQKFFKDAAPKILVDILWDLGHVKDAKDRALLLRLFKLRIKG